MKKISFFSYLGGPYIQGYQIFRAVRPHHRADKCTVTPFKFAAIKVRGFEIMTYSWPFNFAVSYQNYFTVSYINVVFSYTNESRNPVC